MKKLSIVPLLVVISLVLFATFADISNAYLSPPQAPPLVSAAPPPLPPSKHLHLKPGMPEFCPYKCAHRCSRNPRDLCKKLCMHCCGVCKCVPVGPYGDKNQCPCYRDIKNKRGQSKCP
ncbi:hypothetical protein RND81_04G135600 [Saponaria officinalis]|uniref:Uncharacterized protein n=1 Tax=Saponaria officinalis TaxID=3572 RepID=A0AAW1LEA6_SAPOF